MPQASVAPDRSLVLLIAQGDVGAVRELERRHGTTIYALAYGSLQDADAADAVVTSVFADAVEHAAAALTDPECVFAWLVRRARRRFRAPPGRTPRPAGA